MAKSVLGEISTKNNKAVAFSLIGFNFGLGMILGPALGGLLQHPADNISFFKGSLFLTEYPYFLPCLCSASISATGFVIGFFFLPETNARKQLDHESDLLLPNNIEANTEIGMPAKMISVAYALLAFQNIIFVEIFPLWAVNSKIGLNFTAKDIGLCLSIVGGISLSSQILIFPFISRLATPLMLFRYPIFGIAVTIGMLPIATFMENQVSLWLIVITLLGIKCIIEQIVFTSAMMLVQFCLN